MPEKTPYYQLKERDKQRLAEYARQYPESVTALQPTNFIPEILNKIGINYKAPIIGDGYLKLYSQDFIVEEITTELTIQSIFPGNTIIPPYDKESGHTKLQTTLVKTGMDTFEALERLAEELDCETNQLMFAGLKDAKAITSQRITLNKPNIDALSELTIPHLFLKDFNWRKGVENTGNLYGNRFSILVRTPHIIDQSKIAEIIPNVEINGFPNFYSLQRFGPRLNTHIIGKHILMGQYQLALSELLIGISPHEMQLFQRLRRKAANHWGDWGIMRDIYEEFPIFLRYEVAALKSLEQTNGNWVRALQEIKDETRLCVYAYFSYYFNRLLSQKLAEGSVPETLPLIRPDSQTYRLYKDTLPNDEFKRLRFNIPDLPFLRFNKPQHIKSICMPKIWSITPCDAGLIFHFDLQKGSYATSLLSHLFNLYQTKPVPEWVNTQLIDTRVSLGYPPLQDSYLALGLDFTEISPEIID